jgi:hypothetical protein
MVFFETDQLAREKSCETGTVDGAGPSPVSRSITHGGANGLAY